MNIPPLLAMAAKRAVEELMTQIKGIKSAVVATTDGFEVAGRAGEDESAVARLAAMSSSIAAIGVVVGQESQVGDQNSITIEAKDGYVIMVGVENAAFPMIVNVVTNKHAVLGEVLYFSKRVAHRLSQVA